MLAPGDGAALLVELMHREVGHEAIGGSSVPVLLAGLEEHAVARADRLDRAAAALAQVGALGDEDRLPVGVVCQAVRAPGAKWTLAAARREGPDGSATVSM
jgi:hypothetical protein